MPGPPGFAGPPGQPFLSRSDNDEGPGPVTGSFIVDRDVIAGSDDAFERPGQPIEITGTGLISAHVGARTALRCTDLPFQQGAEIVVFTVSATADNTDKVDAEGTWYAHAIDDAPTFSAVEEQIMDLPLTSASVPWNDNDLGVAGDRLTSPNLAAVVQEIVNRPGWEPGNAIALVYVHNSTVDVLSIASFEHTTHPPPSFHGEYELVPQVSGIGTGLFGFVGAALGVVEAGAVSGSGTGLFGFTGAAAGVGRALGSATGLFGFTGTAVGVGRARGTATGLFGFTGTAAGVPRVRGLATGVFGFVGSAEGEITVDAVTGQGTGLFGFTGSAAGLGRTYGTATGVFGFVGTAAGVGRTPGQAAADFGFVGVAAALVRVPGSATGLFGFVGTADGHVPFVGEILTPPERIESVGPELRTLIADREVRVLVMTPQTRVRVLA